MTVLWFLLAVLKYIGIILGVIFLILLAILTIILFVPVRYSIYLSKINTIDMDIEIRWFKRLIYYRYQIKDSKVTKIFKVFGRNMGDKSLEEKPVKDPSKKDKNIKTTKKYKKDNYIKPTEEYKKDKSIGVTENYKKEDKIDKATNKEKNNIKKEKTVLEKPKIIENDNSISEKTIHKTKKPKKTKKVSSKKTKKKEKEKDSFDIKRILNYPNKKEILAYTYKFIKNLFLHIIPDKLYFEGELGLEDPANTGYLLGGIGIIKPYLGNSVNIKGNFDEKVFKGEMKAKGKLIIGIIIKIIIQYLLNKPIREIISLYRKRKEDDNGVKFEE